MKKLLFLLLFQITLAQTIPHSMCIYGTVNNNNVPFGKEVTSECTSFSDKTLYYNQSVLIADIYPCDITKTFPQGLLYSIYIDGANYFVEAKDLDVNEEKLSLLMNMSVDKKKEHIQTTITKSLESVVEKTKGIEILKKHASKGITIRNISIEEGYTTTALSVYLYNPTKKTIKYVWLTVRGLNPVKDAVIDPIKGLKDLKAEAIGPIEPYRSAIYNFDSFWFTDIVTDYKLINIRVQYMDGTFKTIENPTEVFFPEEYEYILDE